MACSGSCSCCVSRPPLPPLLPAAVADVMAPLTPQGGGAAGSRGCLLLLTQLQRRREGSPVHFRWTMFLFVFRLQFNCQQPVFALGAAPQLLPSLDYCNVYCNKKRP